MERLLIIGNSGSGKTWLSAEIRARLGLPVIHLDDLRWQPGHRGVPRDNSAVGRDAASAAQANAWVIEGVYGWLAKAAAPNATMLIWLDFPEHECLENVRRRGIQGGGTEEAFNELLEWIAGYRKRANSSCYAAHLALHGSFAGPKARLSDRYEVADYLLGLSRTPPSHPGAAEEIPQDTAPR